MCYDGFCCEDFCYRHLTYRDYLAYKPVKLTVGLSGHTRVFTVTEVMASKLRQAHINMSTAIFEIVELNNKHHTVDLCYVEYIITN